MNISQAGMLLTLAVYAGSFAGCSQTSRPAVAKSGNPTSVAPANDIEQAIKDRILQESTDPRAEILTIERQTDYKLGGNGPFVYPVSLAASDDSGVYISDNNAHAILVLPPQSESVAALPTQGAAKLVWPNTIQIWKNSVFVSDNDGIKILNRDGSFQRLLKTYYGINDFTVGVDGKIYVNPRFRTHKASNPLIAQIDSKGTRVKAFGERLNHSNYGDLDDLAYLCASPDFIVAVFKHRPIVYVYSLKGEFLRQFSLNHRVFESLAALTEDETFIHPGPSTFRLPSYIAGARLVGNRLLVLLHLPQPEILELNLNGDELHRYQGSTSFRVRNYRGFDARLSGDTYHFWVLAGEMQNLALVQFAVSRKGHDPLSGGRQQQL
jgi:hypothetical protein